MQRERPACGREPLIQRWDTLVLGECLAQRGLERSGLYVKEPAGGVLGHDRLGAEPLDQRRATPASTGVTRPIHSEDSHGVMNGTGIFGRGRLPRARAITSSISP